jgi:hypothetical protein
MARPIDPPLGAESEGVEQLTREQVRERMAEIAAGLGLTLDETLRRLDHGDYDDRIVSSKLRMLRFLDEEPEYQQAAE